jgi:hypothetical protein
MSLSLFGQCTDGTAAGRADLALPGCTVAGRRSEPALSEVEGSLSSVALRAASAARVQ